ncbi:kynureninase [Agromyces binzhouensis]|uniref:Kynureninase n=1 Tax=Agromyces binzhouensis TaxID=1817495 RepID=A0A4V1QRS3_9MICO|nr:kynureninase [Agromyces binzhouensis]RXZ45893.1 kynureninase [Agromyces binzhouensis]
MLHPDSTAPGPTTIDRATCESLDAADPLAPFRERFDLPDGIVYLDGNSLGALPRATRAHVDRVIAEEWGIGLIRSWNDAGWFAKPQSVGDRIAPLIGAAEGEVVLGDSTSGSLFQVVTAAARLRPDRNVIVAEHGSFPTDLYVIEAVQSMAGGATPLERRLVRDGGPALDELLGDDVAVVVLTHVDYRTGRMHDLAEVTARVHEAGAIMVWDLCHSAGAVPIDLGAAGADFAVGCTYKYLNGGPGSPSFMWAASRHHEAARPAVTGWHGHARPFDFEIGYEPMSGIGRFRVGTPQLLSLAALEASLDIWAEVDMSLVREKSLRLTELFMALVDRRLGAWPIEVVTPRRSTRRGSQVALRHEDGYAVMQALIERGVIGDFRAPDLMRFGFTPLYVTHADVWDAVESLHDVLESEVWREPRFAHRSAVT